LRGRSTKRSKRADRAFIGVNCAAIPPSLFASELFGHEKGAFNRAQPKGRLGRLESANGGTIFLDEIGRTLPGEIQIALLAGVARSGKSNASAETISISDDVRVLGRNSTVILNTLVTEGRFPRRSSVPAQRRAYRGTAPP